MSNYQPVNLVNLVNLILVPQGSEYQAVKRGLSRLTGVRPDIKAIPLGMAPLRRYLAGFENYSENKILLMGLCGALQANYRIGDIVLYQDCLYQDSLKECDRTLLTEIGSLLGNRVSLVRGLTSDRLIWSAAEKRHLGEKSTANVEDMEGFAALEFFTTAKLAILRVVSDDCRYDIPNLTTAISPDGALQPWSLARGLISQPLAATRLIRGSLQGLQVLQQVTTSLFFTPDS